MHIKKNIFLFMSKIINAVIFLIIKLSFSSLNNSNFIAIKFKTYYPYLENNLPFLNAENYYKKIHSSKIYLELYTGNETSFKEGKNQTLNTIIDLEEITFVTTNIYFKKDTEINNNLLCLYNTSKSNTFKNSEGYRKYDGIDTLVSFAKEDFKIFTDLSLSKYNITNLNVFCTINHNISTICGNIGLVYSHIESVYYNFLGQIHKIFSLPDFSFLFNYSNYDEGIFIFGNKPHIYLSNEYNENDLLSFYSTYIYDFSMNTDSISIGNNYTKVTLKIKINPDIEGFEFPKKYFNIIEEKFFYDYYNKSICFKENYKLHNVIICKENFTDNDIKAFPKIEFKIENYLIKFIGADLFYINNNRYYFQILERATENYFDLGRIFFKKYMTIINPKDRLIFFYDNKDKDKDKNKEENKIDDSFPIKYLITIIVLSIFFMILFPLGIYIGKKIYQQRKKKAYELNDNFDYTPTKEGSEPLFN